MSRARFAAGVGLPPRRLLLALTLLAPALLLLTALPRRAAASVHGELALGTFTEAIELEMGGFATAQIWPSGKWGARLDAYLLGFTHGLLIEASLARELGQARPHLLLSGHIGAGVASEGAVTISAGIANTLGLRIGPLALAFDATLHVAIERHDAQLLLTGVLALAATF